MKKLIFLLSTILIGATATWYFDFLHDPVESVEELINQDYYYAHQYFGVEENEYRSIQINDPLDEFDSRIFKKKADLVSNRIDIYSWYFTTHKITIWVGETHDNQFTIIDAIRYNSKSEYK